MSKKIRSEKKKKHSNLARFFTVSAIVIVGLLAVALSVGAVMFFRYYNMLNVKERNQDDQTKFPDFTVFFDDSIEVPDHPEISEAVEKSTVESRNESETTAAVDSQPQSDETTAAVDSQPQSDETTAVETKPPKVDTTTAPNKPQKAITNVLLIGADYQTRYGNSDAMIIVSVNRTDGLITLTSVMRDTRVAFPGVENGRTVIWNDKVSNAHAYGGPELLIYAIEKNFGIKIHNYVEVHYEEFVKVFESMNGLDIVMSAEEVDSFNRESAIKIPSDSANKSVTLNGEQVLSFVRMRHLSGSDFMRTDRQRRVLTATFAKVRNMSAFQLNGLLEDILPLVETDMSALDCLGYIINSQSYAKYDLQSFRIPMDGMFSIVNNNLVMSRWQVERTMEIWNQKVRAEDR